MADRYTREDRLLLADALERLLPQVSAVLREDDETPCVDRVPDAGEAIEAPRCAATEMTEARLAAMQVLEAQATAGPWGFHHRMVGMEGRAPETGLDEMCGLGWDWHEETPFNVPPEPMRGAFALGADAAFIAESRSFIPDAIAEIRRLKAEVAREFDQTWPHGGHTVGDVLNNTFAWKIHQARAAIEEQRVSVEAALATLRAKARALTAVLDTAHRHIDGACLLAQVHGVPYAGPTYGVELAALKAELGLPDTEGDK